MSMRAQVRRAIDENRLDDLEELVQAEPRAIRYLLGLTYQLDPEVRGRASRGLALASRHHPKLIEGLIRRLVWAMNDESGTNALTAPEVVAAIAEESPDLLLPMVPDLVRLAADEGLREGLGKALKTVSQRCPGKVGKELQASLNEQLLKMKADARDQS